MMKEETVSTALALVKHGVLALAPLLKAVKVVKTDNLKTFR